MKSLYECVEFGSGVYIPPGLIHHESRERYELYKRREFEKRKSNDLLKEYDGENIDKEFGFWYMKSTPTVEDPLEYYTKKDWLARHKALFKRVIDISMKRKDQVFQPFAMQNTVMINLNPVEICRPLGWMYPCEYARLRLFKEGTDEEKTDINNRCKYCLLDWEGSKCKHPCQDQHEDGDGKGLYNKWISVEDYDYVEGVALARRIMKLPLRKEND